MSRKHNKRVDVGNEEDVAEYKTKVELKRDREVEELRVLLDTYGGRAFIWKVLEVCGIYRSSFATDPYVTARNEGRRYVGLYILEECLNADPNCYTLMRNEAVAREGEIDA